MKLPGLLGTVGLAVAIFPVLPAGAATYDAVASFSTTNGNPNGTFGYGGAPIVGGFTAFSTTSSTCTGVPGLSCFQMAGGFPIVGKNATGGTINFGSVIIPNDVLLMHPAQNGSYSTVLFSAPTGGTYTFNGNFSILDVSPTGVTTDAYNVTGRSSILSGVLNGKGNSSSFSFARTLAAGNQIGFYVGPNGNYLNDSTGLRLSVSSSEPTTGPRLSDQQLNILNTVLSEGQTSASGLANAIAIFRSTGNAIKSFAPFLAASTEAGLITAIARVGGVFVGGATVALDPAFAEGVQAVNAAVRDPNNPNINVNERNILKPLLVQLDAEFSPQPAPPVQPTAVKGTTKSFSTPISAGQPITVDPALGTAFEYKTGFGNPNFASVILPFIGTFQNSYTIQIFEGERWIDSGTAFPLQEFFFNEPGGVSEFRVVGVSDLANISSVTNWISALSFEGTGLFTGSITDIQTGTAVPEPASLVLLGAGLIGTVLVRRRRRPEPN